MKTLCIVIAIIAIFGISSCGPARVGVGVGVGYDNYYGPRPYYNPRPFYNPYYYRRPYWGHPHYRGYYGHHY